MGGQLDRLAGAASAGDAGIHPRGPGRAGVQQPDDRSTGAAERRGDTRARVFCQEFYAELVSIAGVFRVFETIPAELAGKPVQAWLDGDALRFARLDE